MPKWYDSVWLDAYYAALDTIAKVAPSRLAEFERAFDALRTDKNFSTRSLPGVIDAATLEQIRDVVRSVPKEKLSLHELQSFGRFVVHDLSEFTALQKSLVDRASDWAGEALEPSYNFLSLYTQMGDCRPHLDSPSAKWTLDLCIDQSETWPIYLSQIVPWPNQDEKISDDWIAEIRSDPSLRFSEHILTPGDAIFFSGASQWHYRNALPRDGIRRHCDLLFMHFIPQGTGEILRPRNWARLFDIPELGEIEGIEQAL